MAYRKSLQKTIFMMKPLVCASTLNVILHSSTRAVLQGTGIVDSTWTVFSGPFSSTTILSVRT